MCFTRVRFVFVTMSSLLTYYSLINHPFQMHICNAELTTAFAGPSLIASQPGLVRFINLRLYTIMTELKKIAVRKKVYSMRKKALAST